MADNRKSCSFYQYYWSIILCHVRYGA